MFNNISHASCDYEFHSFNMRFIPTYDNTVPMRNKLLLVLDFRKTKSNLAYTCE